ncbi:MAG: hypothetical protein OXC37_02025 [Bdellovibrionaceae bacterium]|nr:hypothetical protein [Pseudobdellovibrionaceae bacterium]
MRAAGIDIGSNTSLLLIVEKTKEGFEVLSDKIYFTRLAENINKKSQISESALSRLDQAFQSMRKDLDKWKVKEVSIVATNAARQAQNKNRIFELGDKYNLQPIKIISPEKEAELTFIGSLFGLGHCIENPLVIDIGGGSTEFVTSKKSYSLNIGSVSLTEKFLSPKALSQLEKRTMNQYIEKKLSSIENFLNQEHDLFIFTAGTPTTLAFMEKQTSDINTAHGLLLTRDHVKIWLEKLSQMTVEERKSVPFLPEHRTDVIVSGLTLLEKILDKVNQKEFIVSATGVRYGLVLEKIQSYF